jgi:hypothetical protein
MRRIDGARHASLTCPALIAAPIALVCRPAGPVGVLKRVAPAETAVAPKRGHALVKGIKTTVRSAAFVAVLSAPRRSRGAIQHPTCEEAAAAMNGWSPSEFREPRQFVLATPAWMRGRLPATTRRRRYRRWAAEEANPSPQALLRRGLFLCEQTTAMNSSPLGDGQIKVIRCPYCGYKNRKTIAWAHGRARLQCAGCGEQFTLHKHKALDSVIRAFKYLRRKVWSGS